MKVLSYGDQGFIEVHNGFLIKYKIVRDEIIKSFFMLQADDYFYQDLENKSSDNFSLTYRTRFLHLFNNAKVARDGMPYNLAPIIYEMRNYADDVEHVLIHDEKTQKQFESLIRLGYKNITAKVVKRIYHI